MTPLFDTWLTIVLLGIFVQLDVLLAPSGLSKTAVAHYDVAAVPSKGVYLVLMAASTFIFPYVRANAEKKIVFVGSSVTLALGMAVTAVLFVSRHLIGAILGQAAAAPFLLISLGLAMSLAGATGVIVSCDVALGVARPWPPLLVGILGIIAVWLIRPTPSGFAAAVLVAQAGALVVSLWLCLYGRRRSPMSLAGGPNP
jgi:hypothetical protein